MPSSHKSKRRIWLALLAAGIAHADARSETIRTDGVYRSEVQTTENQA